MVCWWGCGWCVVWLVPRHSWRRFPCATPRHSWLGFAASGGGRSSPLLAEVSGRRWCVVGLWLVCGVVGPSPLLAEVPVCYSPPLLAGFRCLWWCAVPRHSWLGFRCRQWRVVCGVWCVVCGERRWCVGGVVAGVWCGWSLATPGGGSRVLLPATPGWVSLPVVVGGPRHSWLRSPGGGGVWWGCGWCVVWLVPRHSWRRFPCATPRHSWLGFAAGGGVRFPATPGWGLLAADVRGVWCVVCGVWCAAVVFWWGCGCGWSLATPGGGSCVLLPATPGWVLLPVVVGGPRHSWLRAPGAVPRHSWLGSAGGGGVWWGCGWCVVWLVPRHSWRRFLCATPRHSWLGFAAGGGVRFPATPGWGLLAAVVRGVWCVVCGVWCAAVVCWRGCGWCVVWLVPRHSWRRFLCATPRHSWLGFAASGGGRSSPLLAEGPGRGSPPLLAGVRWRRCVAWSVPRHSWQRFLRATPRHSWLGFGAGGGVWSPASPGWGLLAALVCGVWCVVCGVRCVVCGVRRWCAGGVAAGVWCGWFLATPGGGSCVLLPATPGWVSLPAVLGVPRHSWRRVPGAVPRHSWLGFAVGGGVWCVVCGVWRVACGGGVCGGVVAGVWCGWSLATPGGGSCVLLPATPGWVSLPVVVWGSPPLLAGARRLWWCVSRAGVSFVVCVCGVCGCARWPCCVVCCVFLVSVFLVVWCSGAVGVSSGCPSPWSWCVCVRCVALRVGVGGVGGGGSCAVWLPCVRVCVLAVCGWWGGVCHTLAGSRRRSSAWFKKQKKRSCRCVAEMRGMRDA